MIQIFNYTVYGLHEALIRAKYPKLEHIEDMQTMKEKYPLASCIKLGGTLGKAPAGTGHDKYLRMIHIDMDIRAPRYWWQEFDTYHYTVKMSQSTMHMIHRLDIDDLVEGIFIPKATIEHIKALIQRYNDSEDEGERKSLFAGIKANLPEGLHIVAAISTNYAQLKTMYLQRKKHRLQEWRDFSTWVESLPYAKELGVCDGKE